MAILTLDEAQRMVAGQHPGWSFHDINWQAQALVAGSEKQAILDQLETDDADREVAVAAERKARESGDPAAIDLLGTPGGGWGTERSDRLVQEMFDRADDETAKREAQAAKDNAKPPGWEY